VKDTDEDAAPDGREVVRTKHVVVWTGDEADTDAGQTARHVQQGGYDRHCR